MGIGSCGGNKDEMAQPQVRDYCVHHSHLFPHPHAHIINQVEVMIRGHNCCTFMEPYKDVESDGLGRVGMGKSIESTAVE